MENVDKEGKGIYNKFECYKKMKEMCQMKRRFAVIVLLMMLLPTVCFAQTQEEWNLSCTWKTSCETPVLATGTRESKGTLPANTYVKIKSDGADGLCIINYMVNGSKSTGLVLRSNLIRCTSQYRKPDGWAENVHELDPNHDKILAPHDVILVAPSLLQQGDKDYSDLNFTNPDSPAAEAAQQTAGRGHKVDTAKPAATVAPTQASNKNSGEASASTKKSTEKQEEAAEGAVQIGLVQLGAYTSVIEHEGRELTVLTAELQFSTDVPDGKRLASILAPRTGRCYLRAKASSKGDVIGKCKAGTVVQVVKYGKNYCQIVYEGQVGYVQTACLTFLDPSADVLGTTVLTYNGRATGAAQVPIRNTASNDSCIIVKLRSGTEVTVMSKAGKWYEIAYEGLHGFVHENFMDAEIK